MSNQLVKKDKLEGYKKVYPKSYIDAIEDRASGVSLEQILQSFNMYFLSYNGNKELTRLQVPLSLRREGLWITYLLYDRTVITEWYNGISIEDKEWSNDNNWRNATNRLVGDLTISSDGYWVINGEVTNVLAIGEPGNTPLLRYGSNNKLQASYNEGKTWKDISNDFTINLKISRYIGINEELPTTGIAEGTIYMRGPYYAEDDTSNNNPIYRMWVYAWKDNILYWQDNGEFTSVRIAVTDDVGENSDLVMSQKGVKDNFIYSSNIRNIDTSKSQTEIDEGIKNGTLDPNTLYLVLEDED